MRKKGYPQGKIYNSSLNKVLFMGILVPKPYGIGLLTKVFDDIVKTIAKVFSINDWFTEI